MAATRQRSQLVCGKTGSKLRRLQPHLGTAFQGNYGQDAQSMAERTAAQTGNETPARWPIGKRNVIPSWLSAPQQLRPRIQEAGRQMPEHFGNDTADQAPATRKCRILIHVVAFGYVICVCIGRVCA